MSLIIPANTLASGGYAVDNSCRFDTNAGMNKTAANGTRTKATFSTWIKRSNITAEQFLFVSYIDASNFILFRFTGSEQLEMVNRIGGSNISFYTTNALYRDPFSFFHIVWSLDSTQGTAGNRIKLFVNGTQVTSFATSTTQDADTNFAANVNTAEYYVAQEYTSGYNYFNGYLAETVWIDGLALAADQFGEFDEDSGIWKPIDVSGLTFGTSGFYLDYEDSSNLGNDANGGTDLTENNLAAIDQSTDTCTNNFATMNPLDKIPIGSAITYSDGNLTTTASAGSDWTTRYSFSTIAVSQGKWYVECKVGNVGAASQFYVGVIKNRQTTTFNTSLGYISNNGYGYYAASGNIVNNGSDLSTSGASYTTGDIIGIALDLDSGTLDFYKNGSAQGSQVTSLDTTADWQFTNNALQNAIWNWNFGSPSYSESGGETDGNGYGNFAHAPPSGYFALNTKNLAEYG